MKTFINFEEFWNRDKWKKILAQKIPQTQITFYSSKLFYKKPTLI